MDYKKPGGKPGERKHRDNSRREKRPRVKPASGQDKREHQGPEEMRLNRFIANSGVCSRREADDLIRNGLVSVNGKCITDLGTKVSHRDDVRYKGKRLSAEKRYIYCSISRKAM